ncbi:MAG: hypothetical protein OSJ22_02030 [Rikenellaceae bacterium]|nr:hypothetical protein [Rikenellaceae bacterium]
MDQKERDLFLMTNGNKFKSEHILTINRLLENAESTTVYSTEFKSPSTILIISVLAGQLGIDRYLLGDKKMGTLKLVLFLLMYVFLFLMSFAAIQMDQSRNHSSITVLAVVFTAIFFILILAITILWIYDIATISGRTKDLNLKRLYVALNYTGYQTGVHCQTDGHVGNDSSEENA